MSRLWLLCLCCLLTSFTPSHAQPEDPDGLDAVVKGKRRMLWLTVVLGSNSDKDIADGRDKLRRAEQTHASAAIVEARQELALTLISRDKPAASAQQEAIQLLRSAEQQATPGTRGRAQLVTVLAFAALERIPEAQRALVDIAATGDGAVTALTQHLRAMFSSWQGAPDAPALSGGLQGMRYPFAAIPVTDDWEVVRAVHYLAMTKRYDYAWSSLRFDLLERMVSGGAAEGLSKAETESGVASDAAWQAAVHQFNVDEAHDRPDEAVRHLAIYLSRAMTGLAAERRSTILQLLARASVRQGNLVEARRYLAAARASLREMTPDADDELAFEVELARGMERTGNLEIEIEAYQSAEAVSRKMPESARQVQARFEILQALLRLLILKGDLRQTSDIHGQAVRVAARLDAEPRLSGGRRFHAERLELAELSALSAIPSRREEAARRLEPLLQRMNKLAPVWSRPPDGVLEALAEARDPGLAATVELHLRRVSAAEVQEGAFPTLAALHLSNQAWPEAEAALTQALYADLKRRNVCGSLEQLQYWSDLAVVAEARGDVARATGHLNERINCSGAMNRTSRQSADALVARGRLLLKQRDFYGAEYVLRRALHSLVDKTFAGDLSMVSGNLALASLLAEGGRTSEALTSAADAVRNLVAASIDARGWRELEAEALGLLAKLSSQHDQATQLAFELAQHGSATHAAAALEAFSLRASLRDPALAPLVQRRLELQRRRELIDVRFQAAFGTESAAQNAAQRAALVRELGDVDVALERATDEIARFPGYADLVSGRVVSLPALVQPESSRWLLGEREALLVFSQTNDALFVTQVKRGRARLIRLDLSRTRMNELVTTIRRSLEISPDDELRPFAFGASAELHRRLWTPLGEFLQGIDDALVVNDGPLGSLPLELLVARTPAPGETPAWLDDVVAFSYLPSVSSLRALRQNVRPSRAARPVVVFGPPTLTGVASEAKARVPFRKYFPMAGVTDPSLPCSGGLEDLPPSITQLARDVTRRLGGQAGDALQGLDFTEPRFREVFSGPRLSDYKVVTFVTHGIVAGQLGNHSDSEPSLVLTPPAACRSTSSADDGLLTASEVSELSFDAEWVLLAACNTASPSGVLGAEPLSGLARAFLFAGARALLVSHWSVDASATAELVDRMFRAPAAGAGGKAQQVRAARRELRTPRQGGAGRFAHPALWAGFVLIGDGR